MEDTAKVPMDGKLPAPEIATDVLKRKRSLGCRICCRVCALVSVAIFGYLLYTGVHFGLTFSRGMAYMREEESHLVNTSLTLNGKALQWYKVNDVVMGGHSTSMLEATEEGGLRFSGMISTQDGGFASCSTLEQPLALAELGGGEHRVTGWAATGLVDLAGEPHPSLDMLRRPGPESRAVSCAAEGRLEGEKTPRKAGGRYLTRR